MMDKLIKLFPQCNHSIRNGRFTPHISVGRFDSESQMKTVLQDLQKNWKPIKFMAKELYIIERIGIDPFEVKHIVPFGKLFLLRSMVLLNIISNWFQVLQ
jgi:hypothetical protein